MDIGKKIKELRVAKGLTQEELADRSELSKGFISQVERNLTSPSIATLTDILQCLGFTIGEFFSEEPEEQIVRAIIEGREENHLTQEQLADVTGIHQTNISKLESGTANPSLRTLKRLAAGMGMKLKLEFVPAQPDSSVR